MSEPAIVIRLDGDSSLFQPGETLSGQYWIASLDVSQVKAVECSVLWHTEGKGDEDMAVHQFWRRDADEGYPIDAAKPEAFSTPLPNSPLSYDGRIIKVRWCVRVRVFLPRNRELVDEKRFQLGCVPSIRSELPAL